jgi:hypothetical protein
VFIIFIIGVVDDREPNLITSIFMPINLTPPPPCAADEAAARARAASIRMMQREFCVSEHLTNKEPSYRTATTEFFRLWKQFREETRRARHENRLPNCVACGRPGGTVFSIQRDAYSAFCASKKKCNFCITIQKGEMTSFDELLKAMDAKLKNIEEEIVRLKYNTAFGYVSEHDASAHFENMMRIHSNIKTESAAFQLLRDEQLLSGETQLRAAAAAAETAVTKIRDDVRQILRSMFVSQSAPDRMTGSGAAASAAAVAAQSAEMVRKSIRVNERRLRELKQARLAARAPGRNQIWVDPDEKSSVSIVTG